ncbi:helix-turn-helix domain-containing protein [Streptomyces roseirectus]|uniref:Helix-turn-helix domain-containing protein n=1 Tax=Streptomyces roseirectus TaxID=2768066 RepID=A0A7H0ISU7_9ACTN|nr:helix-turn-helix domain-containing protein [Streptomyces roseirectus]
MDDVEEFAALLRALKDRSGLSYGALAKRLHMSTSTLHRYCNGTAVPNEYAPVERLARACRATPQELVDLHRHWILADTARKRRSDQPRAGTTGTPPADTPTPTPDTDDTDEAPGTSTTGNTGATGATGITGTPDTPDAPTPDTPLVPPAPRTAPASKTRRRTTLLAIAAAVAAATLGAAALVANQPDNGAGDEKTAGVTVPTASTPTGPRSPTPSPSTSPSPSASPSTPASPSATPSATPAGKAPAPAATVPLTASVRPYVYESPCSQEFLVDKEPAQVGPPAEEPNAPRWAAANNAVSANRQVIALTIQGTGEETVVLEALHVRILTKNAPLTWNVYGMGWGCGGNVDTKAFTVDLDQGSPVVKAVGGQRDFPYKVSESDPEVFYVTADTDAHDVRWDLSLEWSSGTRTGTLHLDNDGTPFRTSADDGRSRWEYSLGDNEWLKPDEVNAVQTP